MKGINEKLWEALSDPRVWLLATFGATFLLGGLLIAVAGRDPWLAYQALAQGAFGSGAALSETLVNSTPLIFGGLAFALAARGGLFNIGIEGQLVLGGLVSGWIGSLPLAWPRLLHLPLALGLAALAGGLWGLLPGILKARNGTHEVITSIMLNYLSFRLTAYLVGPSGPLRSGPLPATAPLVASARLDPLWSGTRLSGGLLLALGLAALVGFGLFRTRAGFRLRTVGSSQGAAQYAGISVTKVWIGAMVLSGALAGIGGAVEVLGLHYRYYDQFSPGYGFTAIAVGLVGNNHPLGVVLAGLLFGALNNGATAMQTLAGTPKDLVQILQSLVIFSVAAVAGLTHRRGEKMTE
jgi:ABC-type uncharacterized transport system permease subunit